MRVSSSPSAAKNTQSLLEAARARRKPAYLNGEIRAYCDNLDCSVRNVWLFVNEAAMTTPSTLVCPGCQQCVVVDRVLTLEESKEELRGYAKR